MNMIANITNESLRTGLALALLVACATNVVALYALL